MARLPTAIRVTEEKLLHDSFHDALTGLPNRALFIDHLGRAVERAKGHKDYLFAVFYLDLDRFKVINDSLGHVIGDQLLIRVARKLKACLRSEDTVARLGGDEFAILLKDLKDAGEAAHIADRIQKELMLPFNLSGQELFAPASIGIALSGKGYDSPEILLSNAETAMYRAKTLGKARHVMFDTDMHTRAITLLKLETDLWRAVERQDFQIHYQPVVSLETGKIIGCEALMRWQHPDRGFVPPSEFTPIAEETGLIISIGEWVLRTACAQNKAWQDAGYSQLRMAVNFSARQFEQQDLTKLIRKVLKETGMAAQALELEITESTTMKNINSSIRTLRELSAMGIRISIDDFGTGYSSMGYLKSFPLNTLKIDQSFVRDITSDVDDTAIIKAIIAMAHSLKLKVIAEGVETEEQLAFLLSQQCDEIQGFLFSQPMPAEEFTKLLQKGRRLSPGVLDKARREWGRKRLGELLIQAGFINMEQLSHALKEQEISNEKLGQVLMKLKYINEDILIEFLGKQHGTPSINLYKEAIDKRAINMIPRDVAEKYKVIPVGFKSEGRAEKLIVAMANPSDIEAIDNLGFMTGYGIDPLFAEEKSVLWLVRYYYYDR